MTVGPLPLGKTREIRYPPPSVFGKIKEGITEGERKAWLNRKRYTLQGLARELLPGERVSNCLRSMYEQTVKLLYHQGYNASHYGGVVTCGSVWHCPICASKITERRRAEIQKAIDRNPDKYKFMGTFTFSHNPRMTVAKSNRVVTRAFSKLLAGSPWQRIKARYKMVAYCIGYDDMIGGANGYHPHRHVLFFCDRQLTTAELALLQTWFKDRWQRILERMGYYASELYGVDLRAGDDAIGDYVAKWGAAAELTKGILKQGKGGSYHPFQLLELYGMDRDKNKWAGDLFIEWAQAMKGKRLLRWSKGAKEILGLGDEIEKTDEEIAAEKVQGSEIVLQFMKGQWYKVVRLDLRADVLNVCNDSKGQAFKVWAYLEPFGILPNDYQLDGALAYNSS